MSHQETYRQNQAYSDFLENWDKKFYMKYINSLSPITGLGRILDVGCGIGHVVNQLTQQGHQAHGVEVSETSIQKAKQANLLCQLYDGKHLPFPDNYFTSVGSLNVLEHVEEPELFLKEMVRVTQKGGHIILASPNFYRVIGFRDYHQQMRGISQKWKNFKHLMQKRKLMQKNPYAIKFDRMTPIFREPFQPDDDAIIATNPFDINFFLRQLGCEIISFSCTDRYIPKWLDALLNSSPLRYFMLNSFTIAQKSS